MERGFLGLTFIELGVNDLLKGLVCGGGRDCEMRVKLGRGEGGGMIGGGGDGRGGCGGKEGVGGWRGDDG